MDNFAMGFRIGLAKEELEFVCAMTSWGGIYAVFIYLYRADQKEKVVVDGS